MTNNSNLQILQLRKSASEIFAAALHAVDARAATRRVVSLNGSILSIVETEFDVSSHPIYAVSVGKAALSMAQGLSDAIGTRIAKCIIDGPGYSEQAALPTTDYHFFAGGHPLPNEVSLAAAQAVFDLVDRANTEHAVLIFLVSGGGSAMIESPASEMITLSDLREANRLLVACGASISEINSVRRGFSAVKGGAMARRAPQANIITLIVSDTNPGDEASVASGPTLAPPPDTPDAREVINRYQLQSSLPPSILRAISRSGDADKPRLLESPYYVLLDNRKATDAAMAKAKSLGFIAEFAPDICEQPIEEGCTLLISRLAQGSEKIGAQNRGVCLVSGGEFSCPVRGDGRGGRNLETVLRCALKLDENMKYDRQHTVVLSAGSDGIDGNSLAAGAVADETTIKRARSDQLDPKTFLARSDSYTFFQNLGDVIETEPTGTNVRDVRILLQTEEATE